jgi:hypothetical protein
MHRRPKSNTDNLKETMMDALKKIPSVVWIVGLFIILVVVGIATS